MFNFLSKSPFSKMKKQVKDLYKSLPDLPSSWVDFIVKVAPILTLIGGIFSLLGALPMFGIGTLILPTLMIGKSTALYIMAVISIITGFMMLSAVKPLKEKKQAAIDILFWSSVLSSIGSLMVNLSLGPVLSLAIGIYFIFQIESEYK